MEGEIKDPTIQLLIANIMELERINVWISDFDSILADLAKKLNTALNAVELDSIKKQNVGQIYRNLNTYKNAIINLKEQVKSDKKLVSSVLKEEIKEVKTYLTCLDTFNKKTIKYARKIDSLLNECEDYLIDENGLTT